MKISELVNYLDKVKSTFGDIPVVMSSDSEGNSFGTLSQKGGSLTTVLNDKGNKVVGVCLYPFEEGFYDVIEAVESKGE